jgi:hypothetical protein
MSIVEIRYNPKCRNCHYWKPQNGNRFDYHGKCHNEKTKVKSKVRINNDKACIQFMECTIKNKD